MVDHKVLGLLGIYVPELWLLARRVFDTVEAAESRCNART